MKDWLGQLTNEQLENEERDMKMRIAYCVPERETLFNAYNIVLELVQEEMKRRGMK